MEMPVLHWCHCVRQQNQPTPYYILDIDKYVQTHLEIVMGFVSRVTMIHVEVRPLQR